MWTLEALFQRSVDLVELRAIRNRRLRYYIEQSKSSIYAAA
jgi:predicted nucleotidyltransferase